MNDIYLNEREYALKIIKNNYINKFKPSETINILSRYYRHIEGKNTKEIYELVNSFLLRSYKYYNPAKWEKKLLEQAEYSKHYPLLEIEYIPITENELNLIQSLNDVRMERLAFTLLVCAKYYNIKNDENNNWVNTERKHIFMMAHVQTSVSKQCEMIHFLKEMGMISLSKKVNNTNIKVEFINDDAKVVHKVTNCLELGLEYMTIIGKKYPKCVRCGRWINDKKKTKKVCNNCRDIEIRDKETKIKSFVCIDCGHEFQTSVHNSKCLRCPACRDEHNKKRKYKWKIEKMREISRQKKEEKLGETKKKERKMLTDHSDYYKNLNI